MDKMRAVVFISKLLFEIRTSTGRLILCYHVRAVEELSSTMRVCVALVQLEVSSGKRARGRRPRWLLRSARVVSSS